MVILAWLYILALIHEFELVVIANQLSIIQDKRKALAWIPLPTPYHLVGLDPSRFSLYFWVATVAVVLRDGKSSSTSSSSQILIVAVIVVFSQREDDTSNDGCKADELKKILFLLY